MHNLSNQYREEIERRRAANGRVELAILAFSPIVVALLIIAWTIWMLLC